MRSASRTPTGCASRRRAARSARRPWSRGEFAHSSSGAAQSTTSAFRGTGATRGSRREMWSTTSQRSWASRTLQSTRRKCFYAESSGRREDKGGSFVPDEKSKRYAEPINHGPLPTFDPKPAARIAASILKRAKAPHALIGRLAMWAYLPPEHQEFTKDLGVAVPAEFIAAVETEIK